MTLAEADGYAPAPKGGLAGHAERALKRRLIEGMLRPGERLITRDIAAQLGTSITPVREALLKLVAAGVLHAAPSQSFQVPVLRADEYLEIADIRREVEGLAAERAAACIDSAGIARLRAANTAFQSAKRRGDVPASLAANRAFRFGLYEAAGMPHLLAIIERLWLQIGPTLNHLYPQPTRADSPHNYDRVLDALSQRDGPGVRRAIERAITAGNEILLANLEAAG